MLVRYGEQRYVNEPIENKVFQNLTVTSIREQWDSNSQLIGKGKNIKGADGFELCECEMLT